MHVVLASLIAAVLAADHDEPPIAVALAGRADAAVLATADPSGLLRLRRVDGQPVARIDVGARVFALAASHDPPTFWLGTERGLATLTPPGHEPRPVALGPLGGVVEIVASRNGRWLGARTSLGWCLLAETRPFAVRRSLRCEGVEATTDSGWLVTEGQPPLAWQPAGPPRALVVPGQGAVDRLFSGGDDIWVGSDSRGRGVRLGATVEEIGEGLLPSGVPCVAVPGGALRCADVDADPLETLTVRPGEVRPPHSESKSLWTVDAAGRFAVRRASGAWWRERMDGWQRWTEHPEAGLVGTSPDGRHLAVQWRDGRVSVHGRNGQVRQVARAPAEPLAVSVDGEGRAEALDGKGATWRLEASGWQVQRRAGPRGPIAVGAEGYLVTDAAGSWLWTTTGAREAPPPLWDRPTDGAELPREGRWHVDGPSGRAVFAPAKCGTQHATFDRKGDRLALVDVWGRLCVWTFGLTTQHVCVPGANVDRLVWSEDGATLLTSGVAGIVVHDGRSLKVVAEVPVPLTGLATFAGDEALLASDGGPLVVDLRTGRPRTGPPGPRLRAQWQRLERPRPADEDAGDEEDTATVEAKRGIESLLADAPLRPGEGVEVESVQVAGRVAVAAVLQLTRTGNRWHVASAVHVHEWPGLRQLRVLAGGEVTLDVQGKRLVLENGPDAGVWDLTTGTRLADFAASWCGFEELTYLDGGRRALVSGPEHSLRLVTFDAGHGPADRAAARSEPAPSPGPVVAASAGLRWLAGNPPRLYELGRDDPLVSAPFATAISADGQVIAGRRGRELRWQRLGQPLRTFAVPHRAPDGAADRLSADGRLVVVTGHRRHGTALLDTTTGRWHLLGRHDDRDLSFFAFVSNDSVLAQSSGEVHLVALRDGKVGWSCPMAEFRPLTPRQFACLRSGGGVEWVDAVAQQEARRVMPPP